MDTLIRILITSLAAFAAAYLVPGVHIDQYLTAIILAVVLGLLSVVLKPVLIILTLPITVFTFGFFLLIINAFLVMIASYVIKGFQVDGFWSALFYSILISIFAFIMEKMAHMGSKEEKDEEA